MRPTKLHATEDLVKFNGQNWLSSSNLVEINQTKVVFDFYIIPISLIITFWSQSEYMSKVGHHIKNFYSIHF